MEMWLWVIIALAVLGVIVSISLCCWCFCWKKRRSSHDETELFTREQVVAEGLREKAEISKDERTIDLHGLKVRKAKPQLRDFLNSKERDYQRKGGFNKVNVITGQGNHCKGRGSDLKQAVEKLLDKDNYRFEIPSDNPGMYIVKLRKKPTSL